MLLAPLFLALVGCPAEPKPGVGASRPGASDGARPPADPTLADGASATGPGSADAPSKEPTGDPTQPEFWDTNQPVDPLAPGDDPRGEVPPPPDSTPDSPTQPTNQAAAEPEDDPNDWGDEGPGPGAVTTFPGIRIYKDEGRLEIKGWLNLRRCPSLEFAACTRRGKTHETLLGFDLDSKNGGHQMHLALLMLGLEPSPQVSEQGEPIALDQGDKVVVEVSWRAEDAPEDPTAPPAVTGA